MEIERHYFERFRRAYTPPAGRYHRNWHAAALSAKLAPVGTVLASKLRDARRGRINNTNSICRV
jgi:hypothetical protein